jgi:purine-binding chemotaxis protein CheW
VKALYVIFAVGDVEYAVSAKEVLYMDAFTGATRVPATQPWVIGLVQVRGRVVTAIDLGMRFGVGTVAPVLGARVIVVEHVGRQIGLVVENARHVLTIDDEQIREAPELLERAAKKFVRKVAVLEERLVMLLDVERVIGNELGAEPDQKGKGHGEERV